MDHERCYFFFAGYYTVATASDLLTRYRIANRIVKAPVTMRGSCSFTVLIDAADKELSVYILEREQIQIKRIEYTVQNRRI